jgi:hypothetical protein
VEGGWLLERWSGEGRPVAREVEQEGGDGDLRWVAWEKVEIMPRSCFLLLLAIATRGVTYRFEDFPVDVLGRREANWGFLVELV